MAEAYDYERPPLEIVPPVFGDIPSFDDLDPQILQAIEKYAPPLSFAPYAEFAAVEEVSAEPLLGTATETLLPANGLLLMYGDGGAGKTTLSIDAAAHMAAGTDWLGVDVARPLRIAIIENEGPRGKFRQLLAEKSAAWAGEPYAANISVLEDPWTQFSLAQDGHRQGLAQHVAENEVDVVFMGPLVTLGMIGGGTPDEVSAFEALVAQTRADCGRPFALWFLHHENKSGDVSGAWERVPDTLAHVQAQGNGHTRLVWRKARWSSDYHGRSLDLVWADGRTYGLVDPADVDVHAELAAAFAQSNEWRTYKEAAALVHRKETPVKRALSDLVKRGEFEYRKGPEGRHANMQGYRLSSAPTHRAQTGADDAIPASETASASLRPPLVEKAALGADDDAAGTTSPDPGADDDEHGRWPF